MDQNNAAPVGAENAYEMSAVGGNPYGSSTDANDMNAFFAEVDDLKKSLTQYDDNIEHIETLHTRSLNEVNEEQLAIINNQITTLVEQTSALAQDIRQRLQLLVNRSKNDRTKQTQAENVKRQFKTSVERYSSIESNFRKKYRERAERQYRTVCPEASESEVKEALQEFDRGNDQIFAQALLNSNRRGQAQTALNEVQNRHMEIQQIAKTIEELAQLFHDLEIMVAEQEAPVQEVEAKAQEAQKHIESGVAQTQQAVKSARAARRKKWICLGIIIAILAILAIILGAVFGTK